MLETLTGIDTAIFMFLNVTLANPVTNYVMPVVTSDSLLRALFGLAIVLMVWKGDAHIRWLAAFSLVALLLSDQLSAGFLKPLIGRPRPCHVLENINLLVGCGGGKSMPSSHAANAFAQAVFFSCVRRRLAKYLLPFAAIVALSRVFVGVHYPGDILAGAVLGAMIGVAVAYAFELFAQWRRLKPQSERDADADHS
jgi:undecaprenyl-diphosphatase